MLEEIGEGNALCPPFGIGFGARPHRVFHALLRRLGAPAVIHGPETKGRGEADVEVSDAHVHELGGKGAHVGAGNPRSPETGLDLARLQVFRLNGLERLDVGGVGRVCLRRRLCDVELVAHVAGKVGVRRNPAGLRIIEHQPFELRLGVHDGHAGET